MAQDVTAQPDARIDPTAAAASATTAGDDATVTVIEPRPGWLAVDFRELWHHRELLFFLTWRDIKVRYKQTVLGAAWAIIQPVVSMIVFSIIFGTFAHIPSDDVPYPIFVFAALLPWTFFANAVSQAGNSLVAQANLLTKVYFPRLYIPTACVAEALVNLALGFVVYAAIMLWYMHLPGPMVLMLPVLVLLAFLAAAGVGFLLASVTLLYRDFRHVIPFLVQVWMYASPVVYPASLLPDRYRWIMALNPMSGIIGGFRGALLGRPMDWGELAISAVVTVAVFVLGLYNFRRTERRFADIV